MNWLAKISIQKLLRNGVREHWAWRHRQGGQCFCKFWEILLNPMIFVENPRPRKSSENLDKIWNCWISLQNQLLVNGMSYFEIETQLLTFRKDILPYEFAYHLILQNRNGYRKVEWGDWGVHLQRICQEKNFFFQTRHPPSPKKLLPLHIIEVFAELLPQVLVNNIFPITFHN